MTMTIVDKIASIFGPLLIISMFAIGYYLWRNKLYTIWEMRSSPLWPNFLVAYREHTKLTKGHIGIWFYIAIVSLILSLVSTIGSLVIHISKY